MTWQPAATSLAAFGLELHSIGYQVPVYRIEGMPGLWRRTHYALRSTRNAD
jgi:hypothetical protein